MLTERIQNQEPQPITLSLSEENINDLDEVKAILKKPSGLNESRSGSARFLISLGAKVVKMNRFHSALQAGTDISEILKELSNSHKIPI